MSLGQRLKEARERANLSQAELAELAKVPRSTISGIEAYGKEPQPATLTALARALSVSLDGLMNHNVVVVSTQEHERNLATILREASQLLDSSTSLLAEMRKQTELRSAEARDLSQAITCLGVGAIASSTFVRMLAQEVTALRQEVATLRNSATGS